MFERLRQLVSRISWQRTDGHWFCSYGLSTLLHVTVVMLLGSLWWLSQQSSDANAINTGWTDSPDSLSTLATEAFARAEPEELPSAGGPRRGAAVALTFTSQRSLPVTQPWDAQTTSVAWFSEAMTDEELGQDVGDAGIGLGELRKLGSGINSGSGDGGGGAFFGVKTPAKSVVYVVDRSSSMNHLHASREMTRFQRVKVELLHSIAAMKPQQFFFIIFFTDEAFPMPAQTLQPARRDRQQYYLNWMARIRANGKTDPLESMRLALRLKPDVIYFLTDGAFRYKTAQRLSELSQRRTVINTITFGDREAETLMKLIADNNRGTYRFIP